MSAQPTPADMEWLGKQKARQARHPNLKQVPDRDRPATSDEDDFNLIEDERLLRETVYSMADDVLQLKAAVKAHARALVAWEIHHGRATKRLENFGTTRTNEDTRRAYAIAYRHEDDGEDGAALYRAYVETEGELDALKIALNAKRTIASGLQTLTNHGAKVSGLG